MSKQFRIYYQLDGEEKLHTKHLECAVPITALNQFHRVMQQVDGVAPDKYRIIRLCEVYNSDATGKFKGDWIESDYDLPKADNPDLNYKPEFKEESQGSMESILKEAGILS